MINKNFPNYTKSIAEIKIIRPREAGANRATKRKWQALSKRKK